MVSDFAVAHDRYLPFVRLVASSYPARDADDLVQEGLWGLYLGCCAYDSDRGVPFDAFIKVCIRNRITSAVRRYASDANLVSLEDVDGSVVSSDLPMEDRYAEQDAAVDALRDLVPRLSSLEKNVLDLYLSGLSVRSIAQALRISPKSADNAMTRIKQKIRDHIPY